jgi:hypothetical protein
VTDVTTRQDRDEPGLSAAGVQLLRELTERARAGGLQLTGEGGLLGKLTKLVIEGALEGELDDHLGYEKNDPAGRNGGNSRNGHRAKTLLTDTGPVEITVPRDRDSSFEPEIVAKRQRRLAGVEDMVISLSAKGLTHGEIAAHLAEVYGAEVSKQTITTILGIRTVTSYLTGSNAIEPSGIRAFKINGVPMVIRGGVSTRICSWITQPPTRPSRSR